MTHKARAALVAVIAGAISLIVMLWPITITSDSPFGPNLPDECGSAINAISFTGECATAASWHLIIAVVIAAVGAVAAILTYVKGTAQSQSARRRP